MNLRKDQTKALQNHINAEPDGIWGQRSSAAFDRRFGTRPPLTSTRWPSEAEMGTFYGEVGKNQSSVMLPTGYGMVLAWDPSVTIHRFSCHKHCAPAFTELFTRTLSHYGPGGVRDLRLNLFGGCLNVRKKRGGSTWSTHAWGAAIDLDPDHNALRTSAPEAAFSRPEYDPFWDIVDSLGLVSLGREKDFDWMHIQAATI